MLDLSTHDIKKETHSLEGLYLIVYPFFIAYRIWRNPEIHIVGDFVKLDQSCQGGAGEDDRKQNGELWPFGHSQSMAVKDR